MDTHIVNLYFLMGDNIGRGKHTAGVFPRENKNSAPLARRAVQFAPDGTAVYSLGVLICAWAAARRAIGTRNGEQDT
jgi:hypothetical protein